MRFITDFWAIKVMSLISGVYIVTLVGVLITNFKKSVNFYMSIGTLLLLICVVFVTFNGKIYRNAKDINKFAENNC